MGGKILSHACDRNDSDTFDDLDGNCKSAGKDDAAALPRFIAEPRTGPRPSADNVGNVTVQLLPAGKHRNLHKNGHYGRSCELSGAVLAPIRRWEPRAFITSGAD